MTAKYYQRSTHTMWRIYALHPKHTQCKHTILSPDLPHGRFIQIYADFGLPWLAINRRQPNILDFPQTWRNAVTIIYKILSWLAAPLILVSPDMPPAGTSQIYETFSKLAALRKQPITNDNGEAIPAFSTRNVTSTRYAPQAHTIHPSWQPLTIHSADRTASLYHDFDHFCSSFWAAVSFWSLSFALLCPSVGALLELLSVDTPDSSLFWSLHCDTFFNCFETLSTWRIFDSPGR